MIATMQYLSKGSFPQRVDDLVTVCEMIMIDNKVVASFIIVPVIVGRVFQHCSLLFAPGTDTIHRRKVKDFFTLKFRQKLTLGAFEGCCWS